MPEPTREALALVYWRTALDLRLGRNLREDSEEIADLGREVQHSWPRLATACLNRLRAEVSMRSVANGR